MYALLTSYFVTMIDFDGMLYIFLLYILLYICCLLSEIV